MSINKGLGRGFDSLLPQNFDNSILSETDERIQKVSVDNLLANPEQPRQHFDDKELEALADSIKQYGILQPLIATPQGEGDRDSFYLIAGERRWRAAKLAGLKSVPVIVRTSKQLERLELALVENVQRVDLSPLEQAASIHYLHEQFSQDYATIAKRLGKAPTTLQNTVRLLQLPEKVQESLQQKLITEGHARSILALKDEKAKLLLLDLIVRNGWSVRQAERYVTAQKQGAKTTASAQKRVAITSPQTDKLGQLLKTNVSLRRTAKGGKLEIAFKNETDLKRIVKLLAKK